MITRSARQNGFTLIEILVVLALLGLIATMLPQGLNSMLSRSSHQAVLQATVGAARECTIIAQQLQRSVRLGSQFCRLPNKLLGLDNSDLMPTFHADGTASHTAQIVIEGEQGKVSVIEIDKLTANVSVVRNAQAR